MSVSTKATFCLPPRPGPRPGWRRWWFAHAALTDVITTTHRAFFWSPGSDPGRGGYHAPRYSHSTGGARRLGSGSWCYQPPLPITSQPAERNPELNDQCFPAGLGSIRACRRALAISGEAGRGHHLWVYRCLRCAVASAPGKVPRRWRWRRVAQSAHHQDVALPRLRPALTSPMITTLPSYWIRCPLRNVRWRKSVRSSICCCRWPL